MFRHPGLFAFRLFAVRLFAIRLFAIRLMAVRLMAVWLMAVWLLAAFSAASSPVRWYLLSTKPRRCRLPRRALTGVPSDALLW